MAAPRLKWISKGCRANQYLKPVCLQNNDRFAYSILVTTLNNQLFNTKRKIQFLLEIKISGARKNLHIYWHAEIVLSSALFHDKFQRKVNIYCDFNIFIFPCSLWGKHVRIDSDIFIVFSAFRCQTH